jgi:hypothetical protein
MRRQSSKRAPPSYEIECQVDGKTYRSRYTVSGGLVTVNWVYGTKSAVPGASGPEFIARLLLAELVRDAIRDGYLTL